MRIFGADLTGERADLRDVPNTLVRLDEAGRVSEVRHPANAADLASSIRELASGELFVLGVNLPVVLSRATRSRPVDNLVRRRLGHRLPSSRVALTGEALLATLAAVGEPCLPYPDRDRRRSGLAEVHPSLVLKALLWETAPLARAVTPERREALLRAYEPPPYRAERARGTASWAAQVASLDVLLRCLGNLEGFDWSPTREALAHAGSAAQAALAASVFDATLIAGTCRRYMTAPEGCLFLGDHERGYTIMPADGFIRRWVLQERAPRGAELFPKASLRERLAGAAELHPRSLLDLPGKPQEWEAVFQERPVYEFDNVDELLWWKRCRHLAGPRMPTEGLRELHVRLLGAAGEGGPPLRLVRSRHRTLSFRFEPHASWRARIRTRDGGIYRFEVLGAVYAARA